MQDAPTGLRCSAMVLSVGGSDSYWEVFRPLRSHPLGRLSRTVCTIV